MECTSTTEIWNAITNKFESPSISRRLRVLRNLVTFKFPAEPTNESIKEAFNNLMEMHRTLSNLTDKSNISVTELTTFISLAAMPNVCFDGLRSILEYELEIGETLTLEDIKLKLLHDVERGSGLNQATTTTTTLKATTVNTTLNLHNLHCNVLTNGCHRYIKAGEKRVKHREGSASCATATALKPSHKANLVWTVDIASTDHLTSNKERFELYKEYSKIFKLFRSC
ncbi:hypothetical protein ROZALSC1DRAFT_25015 [Rozella allomycis CSF55]|uniref:Uncharacterized protein n=1 Tax=Rozella allomycis (strain CSF55) TaxID=988480 RepID=A0A4P9YCC8_ROZAC|nr:hypothetical protein ROZALSC1DRAFT_25015 [Rozella allomycis CSF55]